MSSQTATGSQTRKSMKQDAFDHPDFYALDDLLTEEHKLIRSSIRDFVKREISPYIEDWAQRAHFPYEIVKKGYFILNQFGNADNYGMHYKTTGPEIWRDTEGKVTHFVSAMGTTGTIMGVSRFLKEQNPAIQIVGTQPTDGSCIPGIRRWSPEFLPKIFEPQRVDRVLDVREEDARTYTKRLAREEGILAGMSSGGALSAAMKIASEIEQGVIVFIICDRGDRYLSSDLFA